MQILVKVDSLPARLSVYAVRQPDKAVLAGTGRRAMHSITNNIGQASCLTACSTEAGCLGYFNV